LGPLFGKQVRPTNH